MKKKVKNQKRRRKEKGSWKKRKQETKFVVWGGKVNIKNKKKVTNEQDFLTDKNVQDSEKFKTQPNSPVYNHIMLKHRFLYDRQS